MLSLWMQKCKNKQSLILFNRTEPKNCQKENATIGDFLNFSFILPVSNRFLVVQESNQYAYKSLTKKPSKSDTNI